MKVAAPSLTPFLRSNAQGDILALLLLNPDEEFTLSDIAREVGALPATVHREVERLVASTTFLDRPVGRARLLRANPEYELAAPLTEIIMMTFGPRAVLPPLLNALEGIREAHIYGSWAARYSGESGPPPRDIDVVVIGSASRSALAEFARHAGTMLRREVNVTRVAPAEWDAADSPFLKTLKSRPLVALEVHG
ncbi:MAG: hypothetical protein ACOH19_16020 [Rhodoglobus sp.]